ncbi:hypothetical protein F4811DRAFT_572089 [Daldinia bambusicola]|nr:hypothetical protein F4811DRAFT_572089 [Daldinia bambusicola]
MSNFSCGHNLKSRVGANLAYIAQDKRKPCPDCQTRTATGVLTLIRTLQRSWEADMLTDDNVKQHLVTYIFDRFISQRKSTSAGFKQQLDDIFAAWGSASYHMLSRSQLANFSATARARWGSDVGRQALRVVAVAALKDRDIYSPIEPVNAEILATLNNMIGFIRERATAIETFEQLEILFDGAETLSVLKNDAILSLVRLDESFARWNVAGTR